MSRTVEFEVQSDDVGIRVDVAIARRVEDISRNVVQEMVARQLVCVNGSPAKASRRLALGDMVRAEVVVPPSLTARAEDIPLNIVYRDSDLAIVDKPPGLVVHPAPGHRGGTLANALVGLFPRVHDSGVSDERPGIVHRLDKDTSGLMVVALSSKAQINLQQQIAARMVHRRYVALVQGRMDPSTGLIDAPVGRDPQNRLRMAAHGVAARHARTEYEVIESLPPFSLVSATLHTGRTHQIRVHFAALGHPLAGDATYGGPRVSGLDRQFLHAAELELRSPTTGEVLRFVSTLPPDLLTVLEAKREYRQVEIET